MKTRLLFHGFVFFSGIPLLSRNIASRYYPASKKSFMVEAPVFTGRQIFNNVSAAIRLRVSSSQNNNSSFNNRL